MSIRAKTKKRVLILLACVVVLGGALTAFVLVRINQREQAAKRQRAAAMEAVEAGRYEQALEHFADYNVGRRGDAEALYNYGVARQAVEMPELGHIKRALTAFNRVLELEPGHEKARRELLAINQWAQRETETIELANQILDDHPQDVEALRAKAGAQTRLREFEEAMKTAQKLTAAAPDNLSAHLLALSIMNQLGRTDEQLIAYVEKLREEAPDDPRFELLLGYAYALSGDQQQAAHWLQRAAEGEPPGDRFARMLLAQLNSIGAYDEAMSLLERYAPKTQDAQIRRSYAHRLWQDHRYEDLLAFLSDVKAGSPEADSELLAFKAMVLGQAGQTQEAKAVTEALAEREGDNTAAAWAGVLKDVVLNPSRSAQETVEAAQAALEFDPGNPYIHFFLAEAYANLGESEQAIQQWRRAAELAGSWSLPYARLSAAYAETGREMQALRFAQAAVRRAPRNKTAVFSMAQARAQALEAGVRTGDSPQRLLDLLAEIQEAIPDEPKTLPLYIDFLARTGKTQQARDQLAAALQDDGDVPPQETLVRLAAVSAKYDLGLSQQALGLSEKAHGLTPALAYARAERLAVSESPEAGAQYMRQAMDESGGGNSLPWKLAWARYLDRTDREQAERVWMSLADQHPENLAIQRRVLEARSVRDNRAFIDRVIERIKSLTGEEGVSWRLARARWLLRGESSDADAQKATAMLANIVNESPDLLKGRLYLAAALQKTGDIDGALEQLAAASALAPRNQAIQLEQAKLHLQGGNYDEAIRFAGDVAGSAAASPEQKREAALVLAQAGDTGRATEMLAAAGGGGEGGAPPADLALAKLYQRQNQLQKANEVYRELMKQATPASVRSYANFLAAIGRRDDALRVLANLERMNMDPAVHQMVLADFHRRYGDPEQAVSHYQAAIEAAPEKAGPRRQLIDFYLDRGRVEDAFAANAAAREAIPDDPLFSMLHDRRELIGAAASDSMTQPLVAAMIEQPDRREAVLEALRLVEEIRRDGETTATELVRMRRLADRHPRFLAIQNVLTDMYLRSGRYDEAAAVASRAMEAFPLAASPAEKATLALRRQERWNGAAAMAQRWRQRSLDDPLAPDLFLADTYLKLGQPERALSQLEPYRSAILENPQRMPQVVSVYTEALVSAGRAAEAEQLLKPLLPRDAGWRSLWNALAVNQIQDPETAAAWLRRVEPTIPRGAVSERVDLANHWAALGERVDRPAYQQKSLEMLRALAERPDAPIGAVLAYAIRASAQGRESIAEEQYRRALRMQPNLAVAQNNLALLLADRGGDLSEALELARAVQQAHPNEANFYDTLAHVQLARGQYEEAIANLERALELQPNRLEWRVNLAAAHAANENLDEAGRILREIDEPGARLDELSPDARRRLKELRATLDSRQAAAP